MVAAVYECKCLLRKVCTKGSKVSHECSVSASTAASWPLSTATTCVLSSGHPRRTPPQDALRLLLIAHCMQAEADSVHDMHVTLDQDRQPVATSVAQCYVSEYSSTARIVFFRADVAISKSSHPVLFKHINGVYRIVLPHRAVSAETRASSAPVEPSRHDHCTSTASKTSLD